MLHKVKVKLLFLLLGFYFVAPLLLFAQSTDSLQLVLAQSPQDSNRVNILNDLAWEFKFSEPDQARKLLEESVLLSQQLSFPKGEAQAYNNRGVVETIAGDYDIAIGYYQKALDLRQKLGDRKGVASLYNNIGNLSEELGDYVAALDNLQKSLLIREELRDTLRIARTSYNLSLVQERLGNYPEALDYVLRHLSISEALRDSYEIANAHNLLGNIKTELERFDEADTHYQTALALRREGEEPELVAQSLQNLGNVKDDYGEAALDEKDYIKAQSRFNEAIDYYQQAQEIYTTLADEAGNSGALNNIGLVYKNLGSFYLDQNKSAEAKRSLEQAIEYLQQSLNIRERLEDRHGMMEVYNGIGDVRRRQGRLKEALAYTQRYLKLAEELGDRKFIQSAYKDLSRVYAEQKTYEQAFVFRKKYDELRYDRLSEERVRQNLRREAIYGDSKKQQEIERQEVALQLQQARLSEAAIQRNSLIGGAVLLSLLALLLYNRNRIKSRANDKLEQKNQIIKQEQERSEALLLNILPIATAQELKKNGKTKARYYESVTVLFTDFVGFTQIAANLRPEHLVAILDECFRAFDEITSKHGIEKIKTIGDAYMCAGGIPTENATHASDMVRAAFEMQEAVSAIAHKYPQDGKPVFQARIGIHTGPVVAGVVGSKKFAYDIWGDTVNTASRMESSGAAGKINISQHAFEQLNGSFECTYRGKIKAKNKGEIDMYFVVKERNEASISSV